jgi:hypothetical protein
MKTILDTLKQVQAKLEAAGTFGNESAILARVRRDLASIMHIDPAAWLGVLGARPSIPFVRPIPLSDPKAHIGVSTASDGEVTASDSEGEVTCPQAIR